MRGKYKNDVYVIGYLELALANAKPVFYKSWVHFYIYLSFFGIHEKREFNIPMFKSYKMTKAQNILWQPLQIVKFGLIILYSCCYRVVLTG